MNDYHWKSCNQAQDRLIEQYNVYKQHLPIIEKLQTPESEISQEEWTSLTELETYMSQFKKQAFLIFKHIRQWVHKVRSKLIIAQQSRLSVS